MHMYIFNDLKTPAQEHLNLHMMNWKGYTFLKL